MSKQTIHIWKGQEGTMCGLVHIPQEEGIVRLSMINAPVAVNINCDKCWNIYNQKKESKREDNFQADYDTLKASHTKLVEACKYAYILSTEGIGQATHLIAILEQAIKEAKEIK